MKILQKKLQHYSLWYLKFSNETFVVLILYTNIDQTLMNTSHRLLNCEMLCWIVKCHVELWNVVLLHQSIRVHCIHMLHLFFTGLVHVIYLGVSGQCSYTILRLLNNTNEKMLLSCFRFIWKNNYNTNTA